LAAVWALQEFLKIYRTRDKKQIPKGNERKKSKGNGNSDFEREE